MSETKSAFLVGVVVSVLAFVLAAHGCDSTLAPSNETGEIIFDCWTPKPPIVAEGRGAMTGQTYVHTQTGQIWIFVDWPGDGRGPHWEEVKQEVPE